MSRRCKRRPTAKSNPTRIAQVRVQLLTCSEIPQRMGGGGGGGGRGRCVEVGVGVGGVVQLDVKALALKGKGWRC